MSTVLLALDTATEAVGWGVARMDGARLDVLASGCTVAPRRANTILLDTAVAALDEAGLRIADVGGVVVGRGPGSFTGVRIGVATAKGLAQGLGVPLAGVGTLDAIAWQCAARADGLVGIVGDAMRGEVYPALFRCEDGVATRLSPDRVAKPADVADLWARQSAQPVTLCGNGMAKYEDIFREALAARATVQEREFWWPSGRGLFAALLGAGAGETLAAGDPATLLPIYTRLSDAEENELTQQSRPAALPDSGVAGESGGGST